MRKLAEFLDRSGVLLVTASWLLVMGIALPVYMSMVRYNISSLDGSMRAFLAVATVLLLVGGIDFTRQAYRQYQHDYGVQSVPAGTTVTSAQRPPGRAALVRTQALIFAVMFGVLYLELGVQMDAGDFALVAGALSLLVMVVMTVAIHLFAVRPRRSQESRRP